jgi:15-cis-phytoene synthase
MGRSESTTGGIHARVFREGSKTYFNSSRFFPPEVRQDVYVLYGFVRVADNFVDAVPQRREEFYAFKELYNRGIAGERTGDPIIDSFVELALRKQFDPAWTDAFLRSMEWDLSKTTYRSVEETLAYVYGSAEVVGLFMVRILGLPLEAEESAAMLGRAMQFINFIRDIDEDNRLGRTYLPLDETSLPDLKEATAMRNPEEFRAFLDRQLVRYRGWQAKAEAGYRFLPHRYLVPIKTAGDMYNWTGARIAADPFIVFRRKVKPKRRRIVLRGLKNALFPRHGVVSHA